MFVVRNEAYENSQPFHKHSLMMNKQTFKLNPKGKCFSFEYWSCHEVKLMRKGFNARRSQICSVLRLSRQTRTENSLGNISKTCLRWILAIRLQSPKWEAKIFCGISKAGGIFKRKNYQTREIGNQTNVFYAKHFCPSDQPHLNINNALLGETFTKETRKLNLGREASKKLDDDWQKTNVITKNDWKISSIM